MTDASTFGNFAKIDFGRRKALPNVLHGIHADTIGQNLALRKWQDLPADERQHLALDTTVRRLVAIFCLTSGQNLAMLHPCAPLPPCYNRLHRLRATRHR